VITLELEVPKVVVLRLHLHDVVVLGEDVLRGGPQTGVDLGTCSMVGNNILRRHDLVEVKDTRQQMVGPSLDIVVHVSHHATESRM
jgi:hypothetical protein